MFSGSFHISARAFFISRSHSTVPYFNCLDQESDSVTSALSSLGPFSSVYVPCNNSCTVSNSPRHAGERARPEIPLDYERVTARGADLAFWREGRRSRCETCPVQRSNSRRSAGRAFPLSSPFFVSGHLLQAARALDIRNTGQTARARRLYRVPALRFRRSTRSSGSDSLDPSVSRMPLFSRRKSETNLQAPSGRSPRPPGASRAFDAGEAVNPAPDARKARSRSSTREQRATRPERDVPPVPMKGSTLGPELENWNSESPTTRARSNLPPGAMPSRPPSAQYHAVTTSTPSPSTRAPLRQSSLGPIPAAHDSSFASTSSYSPAQTPNSQISSPVLHTSPDQLASPPQNLSSSLRVVSTDPRYFHTPPRRSSRQDSTNPPISSSAKFARSFSTSNQSTDGGGFDYTSAADGVIAMASSSSFYAGSPHQNGNGSSYSTPAQSPTASPRSSQLPHRQSSLIHAALTESLEHSPSQFATQCFTETNLLTL